VFPPLDWQSATPAELVARVAEAGVIGMGGAGFPTHVKLSPPKEKPVDTLILNGAECEPWLTCDHRLMLERAAEIWTGCRILKKILGAKTLSVAIEDNKPDAIAAMRLAMDTAREDGADITILRPSYPQGAEKQLIFKVAKRKVPRGGLPMDVGCVVENVATALAVCEAVANGLPLTHRVVTVSGDAVAAPANLLVPCGAPFSDLIAACGGATDGLAKIICGGPMMGLAQADDSACAGKTTSGLLLFSAARVRAFTSEPCISCGRCVDACPMSLMPTELSQCIESGDIATAEALHVMDCYECGSCAYVCPARRPMTQHMRRAKALIVEKRKK
jgi:electron transport complex protein RnfC